jgi:hypothetical protein
MVSLVVAAYARSMRGNSGPSRSGSAAGVPGPPVFDAPGKPSSEGTRLVLLEEGAGRWFDSLDADSDTVTVVQSAAERPMAFALRAVQQILAIEQSGRNIGCAHLLVAPRCDPEVTAARLLIARGLITHAASLGSGASELLLRAHRRSHCELQRSLPCWLDALSGPSGTGVLSWAMP